MSVADVDLHARAVTVDGAFPLVQALSHARLPSLATGATALGPGRPC